MYNMTGDRVLAVTLKGRVWLIVVFHRHNLVMINEHDIIPVIT